jgi:hypothetical protein
MDFSQKAVAVLLYVLYEVLSGTVVGAIQLEHASAERLAEWLQAYQQYPVLATLSDGEDTLIAALKKVWSTVPHQRCQEHFLGNVAEKVLDYDSQLRQDMRQSLGGLPKVEQNSGSTPLFRLKTSRHETQN